ncbi:Uncharacterised protein [uncultured archaeon]|nr:Uncharacterised protein [uncultured archaeon]
MGASMPSCDENRAKKILIAKYFKVPTFNMPENPDSVAAPWFKTLWKEFLAKGHKSQNPQGIADEFIEFSKNKQAASGKDPLTFLADLNDEAIN